MGEFFNGWNRKIGVLTLLLACVLMGWWVRSLRICDDVYFCREQISLVSKSGAFFVFQRSDDDPHNVAWQFPIWQTFATFSDEIALDADQEIQWRMRSLGFDIGELRFDIRKIVTTDRNGYRICWWQFPYWSILIPLTFLSLRLLLSKHRLSNTNKLTEPRPPKLV